MEIFFLKSLHGGFEAVWLPIAGECAKPNLKLVFEKFSWQANPVFGGVAFFPISNYLFKVTLYVSKVYHFITFSDFQKRILLSGKRLPPKYRVGLPGI